jgi:hypothetical protein
VDAVPPCRGGPMKRALLILAIWAGTLALIVTMASLTWEAR